MSADRISWAAGQMPVLRAVRERFAEGRPLDGVRVGACLHLTAETAVLVEALEAGGAEVVLASANPYSTQDDVVAHLGDRLRPGSYDEGVAAVAQAQPQVVLDDGGDVIAEVHARDGVLGGLEETTTGLLRLRRMEPACPVLAVNEARAERSFNDRFGTGQSVLDGIVRATNLLLAGRTVVVLGYGPTGKGIALRAHGLGASVIVCEVDPLRALEARMEGFAVLPAIEAAARGDVFVTVTGSVGVLRAEHFVVMPDGAVLANAGHFDREIDLGALRASASAHDEVRPLVERFVVGGRALHLLAGGRVVNLAAAEGHPPGVMDLSFALQALCVEHLVVHAGALLPGVQPVPSAIDEQVARLKLASLGVAIDEPTDEQRAYRDALR